MKMKLIKMKHDTNDAASVVVTPTGTHPVFEDTLLHRTITHYTHPPLYTSIHTHAFMCIIIAVCSAGHLWPTRLL